MDLKCAAVLLFLATCIFAQNQAEVDVCGDIRNGRGGKHSIVQINRCARVGQPQPLMSMLRSLMVPCPTRLPCMRENNCRFGYSRNTQGCFTCECLPETKAEFYQSDIVLTQGMKLRLSRRNSRGPRTRARRGAGSGILLWNNLPVGENYEIPYTISGNIGRRGQEAIAAAIKDFEAFTCLRFVERAGHSYFINFYNGGVCTSPVGREERRQRISLSSDCWDKGSVIHEVMHSLGFWHEQSRPDRDNHVRINFANVQDGEHYNFDKMDATEINSFGSSYDIGSIMHYESTAWTKNGRPTITDLDGQAIITQDENLSQSDIEQLNRMYRCGPGTGKGGGTIGVATEPPCIDKDTDCSGWAFSGECSRNPVYMLTSCCASCTGAETGTSDNCSDEESDCPTWASSGECSRNPSYMLTSCCASCKAAEQRTVDECRDKDRNCPTWASRGECTRNPGYMRERCCFSCRRN